MSNKPSLWKQLLGAVIGGSLGLLVYSGYQVASPAVTSWLTIPQQDLPSNGEGSRLADNDRTERTNSHFEARAREIAQEFGAAYKNYQVKEAAPEVSSASSEAASAGSSTGVIPFEGATASESFVSSKASSADPSADVEAERTRAVREMWKDENIEKAPGPDTDELPDSGLGVLGALVAAGAGAGGLRARKRK